MCLCCCAFSVLQTSIWSGDQESTLKILQSTSNKSRSEVKHKQTNKYIKNKRGCSLCCSPFWLMFLRLIYWTQSWSDMCEPQDAPLFISAWRCIVEVLTSCSIWPQSDVLCSTKGTNSHRLSDGGAGRAFRFSLYPVCCYYCSDLRLKSESIMLMQLTQYYWIRAMQGLYKFHTPKAESILSPTFPEKRFIKRIQWIKRKWAAD